MKNPILRFGLIGGIVLFILAQLQWQFVGTSMSYNQAQIVGYLSIIFALTSIYFAVRKYREEVGAGYISFGKAFQIGSLTALIPAAFMFVSTVIFYLSYGEEFKAWALAEMQKTTPPEKLAMMMEQYETNQALYDNPYFQGLIMFLTVMVIGLIVSAITAFILQKKRPIELAKT